MSPNTSISGTARCHLVVVCTVFVYFHMLHDGTDITEAKYGTVILDSNPCSMSEAEKAKRDARAARFGIKEILTDRAQN